MTRGHSTGEPPSNEIPNGDFEKGRVDWTEYSQHGWELIKNTRFPGTVTPHGGSWASWLGGDYDDVSYIQQTVTVDGSTPYLHYWHWIASADFCGYDFGIVKFNGNTVETYDLCGVTGTGGWVEHSVNLSAYAGQTAYLQIRVETDAFLNSNLFIDDVSFQATAGSLSESPTVVDEANAAPRPGVVPPEGPLPERKRNQE
jgi:hypothetical protein